MQQATSRHVVDLGGSIRRILTVSHSVNGKRRVATVQATGCMDHLLPALQDMFVAPIIESGKLLKSQLAF